MFIYKQYNEEQLNNQYNIRLHVPDFATYIERWEKLSCETREKYPFIKDVFYGDNERECFDVFPSAKSNSKTLVYIHGGYWHLFDKTKFHFIADAFYADDVTTVIINYPLAPAATIDEIVASCRKAILWLHDNLLQFNGDPQQVYIMGNSAGAHLAAMIVEKKWMEKNTASFIKGVCLLSGIFNLLPIQLLQLNSILNMSSEIARRNSPVELSPANTFELLISAGGDETNEFKCQSRQLYDNWKDKNTATRFLELPGINHYSMLEPLLNKASALHIAMRKMMNLCFIAVLARGIVYCFV
jgi:arylformamidase